MNINSINSNNASGASASSNKNSASEPIGKKGQIIEGLITKVSDEISINFNGKEFTVPKSSVQKAKEGDIIKFEIKDISENHIVLKEVGSDTKDTSAIKATCTNVETDQTAFKNHLEKTVGEKDAAEEREQQITEEKRTLEDIANRMTSKDYEELMKEGSILEAYDVVRLDMALDRIKEQRAATEAGIEKEVVSIKEQEKVMEETTEKSSTKGKTAAEKEIIERLMETNLPVTDENIEKISNALELAGDLKHLSDKDMNYLVGNHQDITISNLYKATYSSGGRTSNPLTDEAWNQIKGQAASILEEAGLEADQGNMEKARWLIENNIELNKENLLKLTELKDINNLLDSHDYKEELLHKIVDSVAKGIAPEQTPLGDGIRKSVEEVLDIINKATDSAIAKAAKDNSDVSLWDIKKAEKLLSGEIPSNQPTPSENDIHLITARRQLEEIRLKMTVEAAGRLASKGFDLHTDSLAKIVQGLREEEDAYYNNLLKESKAVQSDENIQTLKDTVQKVNQLKELPSYLLGATVNNRSIQTIDSLCLTGQDMKVQLDKAMESYDSLMTAPRKDLGDSIQKAFGNVDNILTDMNLETTEANRRAVKILGYNSMTINEESVVKIKEYDAKLNNLIKDLHPATAVELIKEGINPVDMPVDELTEKVNELKRELGVTGEERYSKYLVDMERNNSITPEERKAYIGIYRLLNNVEKTNGAAVGAVVKAEQDMTLKNLLTAARTIKSHGIDKSIDDSFGVLESLTFQNETITDQLGAAFKEKKEPGEEYFNTLVNNIMEEITPEKLDGLIKGERNVPVEDVLDMSLEKFSETVHNAEVHKQHEAEYTEEKVQEIQNIAKESEEPLRFLENYKIPATIANLQAAKELMAGNLSPYTKVKDVLKKSPEEDRAGVMEAMEGMADSLDSPQAIEEQYNKFEESVSHILNKQLGASTITSRDIADLKSLRNGIQLVASMARKQTYEIPLLVGDSITNINLTIVSGGKENGKIDMTVASQKLGTIEAGFSVKNNKVSGLIMCENRETLEIMKESRGNLEEGIVGNGLSVKQLNYGIDQKINASYVNKQTATEKMVDTDTRLLYQTAKAFVYNVKAAEVRKDW